MSYGKPPAYPPPGADATGQFDGQGGQLAPWRQRIGAHGERQTLADIVKTVVV